MQPRRDAESAAGIAVVDQRQLEVVGEFVASLVEFVGDGDASASVCTDDRNVDHSGRSGPTQKTFVRTVRPDGSKTRKTRGGSLPSDPGGGPGQQGDQRGSGTESGDAVVVTAVIAVAAVRIVTVGAVVTVRIVTVGALDRDVSLREVVDRHEHVGRRRRVAGLGHHVAGLVAPDAASEFAVRGGLRGGLAVNGHREVVGALGPATAASETLVMTTVPSLCARSTVISRRF